MSNTHRNRNRLMAGIQLLLLAGILLLVNILADAFNARIDLTAEHRFSVSRSTGRLVRGLDDVVFVRVFLSGDLSPNLSKLEQATRDLLSELKAQAGDNIEFEFFDPNSIEADSARYAFVQAEVPFGMGYVASESAQETRRDVFPSAIVSYRDRNIPVLLLLERDLQAMPFLTPDYDPEPAVSMLEYSFANAIRLVSTEQRPKVAFVQGHGEWDSLRIADISRALSQLYELGRINLRQTNTIDTSWNLLIVAGPREKLPVSDKFKLDQYLMYGGRILWLLDALVADFDSLRGRGEFMTMPLPLDLEDQLYQYGVRINNDLIQDFQCTSILVPSGNSYAPRKWFYNPIINNFNPYHPITRSLDAIEGRFVSTIDTIPVEGVRKTILAASSNRSRVLLDPVRVRFNLVIEPPRDEQFAEPAQNVAILLEGRFPSAFRNLKSRADELAASGVGSGPYRDESPFTKMIVLSDADLIRNAVDPQGRILPLGQNNVERYIFANKNFLLNCIEYLADDSGLMDTRAKEIRLRPLDAASAKASKGTVQALNIALPVLLLVLFSLIYNYIRNRKYGAR